MAYRKEEIACGTVDELMECHFNDVKETRSFPEKVGERYIMPNLSIRKQLEEISKKSPMACHDIGFVFYMKVTEADFSDITNSKVNLSLLSELVKVDKTPAEIDKIRETINSTISKENQ